MQNDFLQGLNEAQLKAATYPYEESLQILAGPGSGKTKVLTSRIAHLIVNCCLSPRSICAVTFTNKAANEMKERLTKLIGKERTSQLKMGTFHSLCARFLRKYPKEAKVPVNFTVCDASESKKMVATLLKGYADIISGQSFSLEPAAAASMISKAKSQGISAKEYLAEAQARTGGKADDKPASLEAIVGNVYVGYEAALRSINALDFDDLLVYGGRLFADNKECALWCRHILVDEFQDTNITQYQLMRAIGFAKCVTIVGDPDQSIYGWRSAEVKNLDKMRRDFPNTTQIFLEENYRSTASILNASLAIVSQDSKRINKSLYTSHPEGIAPILYQTDSENDESKFIAIEIKRLAANMGGTFSWGDFSILLRYNALSRSLERALQNERVPCRILGGHKFFERLEVKDVLAYLQLIDNPAFVPALTRIVNVPARGIGEKTLNDISRRSQESGKTHIQLLEGIYDGRLPDQKPTIRKKIASFVQVMRALRTYASEGLGPSDLLWKLVDLVQYEEHLKKTQQDWETRWENVKELISFAKEVEEQNEQDRLKRQPSTQDTNATDVEDEVSPLRQFLQASMLSSEGDNDTEEDERNKVTISTCHSAKGLEWPVVFIPSVDSTTYPFIRSEDEDEERRLLYVACTRAKSMLYLTRTASRMVAGDTKKKALSKFIAGALEKSLKDCTRTLFIQHLPHFESEDRKDICKVLGRPVPDDNEVAKMMEEFYKLGREVPPNMIWRVAGANTNSYPAPPSFVPANLEANFSRPSLKVPHPVGANNVVPSKALFQRPTTMVPDSTSNAHHHPAVQLPGPSRVSSPVTTTRNKPFSSARQSNFPVLNSTTSRHPVASGSKPSPSGSNSNYPAPLITSSAAAVRPPTIYRPPEKVNSTRKPPASPLRTVSNQHLSAQPKPQSITRPIPVLTPTTSVGSFAVSPAPVPDIAPPPTAVKRRLGVGRATTGYTNKKFKRPVGS